MIIQLVAHIQVNPKIGKPERTTRFHGSDGFLMASICFDDQFGLWADALPLFSELSRYTPSTINPSYVCFYQQRPTVSVGAT